MMCCTIRRNGITQAHIPNQPHQYLTSGSMPRWIEQIVAGAKSRKSAKVVIVAIGTRTSWNCESSKRPFLLAFGAIVIQVAQGFSSREDLDAATVASFNKSR